MTMAEQQSDNKNAGTRVSFWHLTRDLLSFQVKLLLDGLRDLLLSPVSILAALVGIVRHPNQPDYYFRRLLRMGRKSDQWINLFGGQETDDQTGLSRSLGDKSVASSDDYIRRLESLVIIQYEKGGIVKGLKDGTDELVRKIQKRRSDKDS